MAGEAIAPASSRTTGAAARVPCAHCGLTVPAGLVEPDAAQQFCCGACRAVWDAIHGCGLERYYELRDRQGAAGKKALTTGRGYEEFDDPTFRALYCRDLGNGVLSAELFLEGVHCVACVWLVEKLPELEPGLLEARLDLGRSLVRITWDSGAIGLAGIARALDRLGYVPHPAKGAGARDARRHEDRAFLSRLAVAGALAGNVMLMSWALYAGIFGGIEREFEQLFRWTSMVLTAATLAWPGRTFFRGALAALRTRTRTLDLPIALGLTAGMATSVVNTILGPPRDVYFDTIAMLVFLLLCGRWIQHRQQRSATDAVELLYSLTPARARIWEAGQTRDAPIDAVTPGTLVEVRADESFPVDGLVVEGQTSVDQSILSGESRPVRVAVGQRVSAGSVNLAERVLVKVEAAGAETRVGRLMRLVEESALRRAPIVKAADRVAAWFVAAVIGLAAITLAIWLWIRPAEAIDHALALLIVTCPCALGIATPLAVTAAIGRAASRGIMIKGGEVLERLNRPGVILLDKTGTITEGRQKLIEWTGDESAKPQVAAIEAQSSHPVARALATALGPTDSAAAHVEQRQGLGVCGLVEGQSLAVGSPAFVIDTLGSACAPWARQAIADTSARGLSPIVVARAGAVIAVAALGDALRADAKDAVARLRRDGWRVRILSGDDPGVVRAVGEQLGLPPEDLIGGASPEEKLATVERETAGRGAVVMVGDGVNDAAALARASVGVAVSGGAEASLAAADVYMLHPGLAGVVELCRGSRRAVRAIHRGLVVSLTYNALAASFAMTGHISALFAAVLMPLSGLTVLAIALRSRTFGDHACR